MQSRVALIRQSDYELKSLEASIRRAIELSGFDLSNARGRRILLKPNMLGAYPPSMGVTTHPNFVAAAGRIFKAAGAQVSVGDSPNGVHPIEKTWEVTGMDDVCSEEGFLKTPFEASGSIEKGGYRIAGAPLEADMIVNLPKFKTHSLTVMTLAVKNLFGCVNGMQKSDLHRRFAEPNDFSKEVVQIAECVSPRLSIVDGVEAMEGDGPSGGDLFALGVIAAGTNMHSVDEICCRIVGANPLDINTLQIAHSLKLWNENEVEVVGCSIDELKCSGFKLPSTYTRGSRDWWISRLVMRLIWNHIKAQPIIDEGRCKRCGLCVNACPVSTIIQSDSKRAPRIESKNCIRCFCCHEVCPYRAISIKQSVLLKTWRWFGERRINRSDKSETGETSEKGFK